MRFATFAGERTISELVRTHYGALGAAEAKRAEKLIVEANPQLKSLAEVPRGAVLRHPPIISRKAAPARSEDTTIRLDTYERLFEQFAEELRAGIDAESRALKEDERIGTEVRRMIDQVPDARELLEEVR